MRGGRLFFAISRNLRPRCIILATGVVLNGRCQRNCPRNERPVTDWVRQIYEDHRRLLFRVAWLIVRRTDLAEDAVHTAFSRIVSRPPNINGNARGYVLKAVRNAAIDLRRQLSARRTGVVDDWEQVPAGTTISQRDLESLDAVRDALQTLDDGTQEIIQLHIHEQMTFREIGELIDVPLQTVASRYRRGLRQIQAKVRDDDRPD